MKKIFVTKILIYSYNTIKKGGYKMPENNLNIQNDRSCSNNNGILGGMFGGNDYGNNDSTILFFIIIFLLLFTNFGCCNR